MTARTDQFYGRQLDAAFILSLAIWWTFRAWRRHAVDRLLNAKGAAPSAHITYRLQQPLLSEGLFKMVVATVGAAIHVYKGMEDGSLAHLENIQQACVYSFYLLSGIADLLTCKEVPVPRGADRAVLLLAFCVEALIVHSQLDGRPPLDTLMQGFVVYTAVAKAACLGIEMVLPDSVLASLGTAFFGLLQGAWVLQISFALCSPGFEPWEQNHQNLMYAGAVFTWYMAAALLYLVVTGSLTWLCYVGCHIPRANEDFPYTPFKD